MENQKTVTKGEWGDAKEGRVIGQSRASITQGLRLFDAIPGIE